MEIKYTKNIVDKSDKLYILEKYNISKNITFWDLLQIIIQDEISYFLYLPITTYHNNSIFANNVKYSIDKCIGYNCMIFFNFIPGYSLVVDNNLSVHLNFYGEFERYSNQEINYNKLKQEKRLKKINRINEN